LENKHAKFEIQKAQLLQNSKLAMKGWNSTLFWYKLKFLEYGNKEPIINMNSNPYLFDIQEYKYEITPESYRSDKYRWIPGIFLIIF
jgi:hypothetical protein